MSKQNQKTRERADVTSCDIVLGLVGPDDTAETEAVCCGATPGDGGRRGVTGDIRGTDLPPRQADALRIMASYYLAGFGSLTNRMLADEMGIRSTNGTNDHLRALARKGLMHQPIAGRWVPTHAGFAAAEELIEAYNAERGIEAA